MLRHTVFSHKHWLSQPFAQASQAWRKLKTLQASSCLSPLSECKVFKVQAFPKKISSTTCQGTGPWEVPVHFSRFVPSVHNCSKRVQSWSWIQEKNLVSFSFSLFFFRFLSLSLYLYWSFYCSFSSFDYTILKWTFWGAKGYRINMLNPIH